MDNTRSSSCIQSLFLMSSSFCSQTQFPHKTCHNSAWSHCSSLLALPGSVCPSAQPIVHHVCSASPIHPGLCHSPASFPFPQFCFRSPPVLTLHLVVFSIQLSLMSKLLVSVSKPWSCSRCLALSQAPYLDLLSVFTPLVPRVLPSSHVWMCT